MIEKLQPYYNQENLTSSPKVDHIAYLGIYNADAFRTKIEFWLPKLNLSQVHLVIADNLSTDSSRTWLLNLANGLGESYTFLQNDGNFGGYGGFMKNLPKFPEVRWITTLHQDDEYAPEHIQEHRKVLNRNCTNLGMICSEFESVSVKGNRIPYPRAHWALLNTSDIATIFLAHLKKHSFPFSGATFAREVFEKFPVPWHSSAFPDTEIVMKMCAQYKVVFAEGAPVRYLENPGSESHALVNSHREFGTFQALIRVFAHENYAIICHSVPQHSYGKFIKALMEGIALRFDDERLRDLVSVTALEYTAQHLGMFSELALELAKRYQSVSDKRAVEVLSTIGNFAFSPTRGPSNNTSSALQKSMNFPIKVSMFLFGLLPLKYRKFAFRLIVKSPLSKKFLKKWNFNWRSD